MVYDQAFMGSCSAVALLLILGMLLTRSAKVNESQMRQLAVLGLDDKFVSVN